MNWPTQWCDRERNIYFNDRSAFSTIGHLHDSIHDKRLRPTSRLTD